MTDEEKNLAIQSAYEQALSLSGADKPTYQGTYDQQIADTYDKIANREDFSYDLQGDPLYQQMKDRYINQGKLAMKDTMGTAAGLTGGYGSSYSQSVGQQQYDAYLQNLTDQIPELWQNAYNVYQDEGTALQNQYSMLRDLGDTEYSRYRNELADWQSAQESNYNKWTDAYNRVLNEENTAYNRQQTAYSNLYQLIGATGYSPTDEELSAAGMTRAQANALIAAYQAAQTASSGGSGGSGGGYEDKNGTSTQFITEATNAAKQYGQTTAIDYINAQKDSGAVSAAEAAAALANVRGVKQTAYARRQIASGAINNTSTTKAANTTSSNKSSTETSSKTSSTYVPTNSKLLNWFQKLIG